MSSLEVTRLIVTIHRSSNKAMGKMMQNESLNGTHCGMFWVNFTRWTRLEPGTGVWPASREEQPGDVKGSRNSMTLISEWDFPSIIINAIMEIWSKKVSKRVQWVFLWFSLVQIRKKSEAPPQFLTPAPHSSAWAISTSAACDERPSTDWQILCFTPRYRWPSWQHLVPWSGPVENTSPKETWCPVRLCPNLSYIDIFGAFGYILGTNQKKQKSTANRFSLQDQPAEVHLHFP